MFPYITRRQFLRAAGAAASVTAIGPSLSLIEACHPPAPLFVRRDVAALQPTDPIIMSYRRGVKAMQALSSSDPRSWVYQAAIHGTSAPQSQSSVAWNTCQHGNDLFWSWHRMYLYWFERIIRQMSGDPRWALPYWNYANSSQRQLPAPFRDVTSELYTINRDPAMNDGTGSLPSTDVDPSAGLGLPTFDMASTSIETTPHNAVHDDIGGWMGSIQTAAQDPIFFLHHSNIDRLWDAWLAQGSARVDPLTDGAWTATKFTFFNEMGGVVVMTGCDVLRAAQQLSYTYEGAPAQIDEYCPPPFKAPVVILQREVLVHLPIPPELGAEPVSFPIDVSSLRQRLAELSESSTATLLLELEAVEADRQPGAVWEVYVGLPVHGVPDPTSPYYVGNLALFGAGIRADTNHAFVPARFSYPINRAMAAALKANGAVVPVTFVAHGILVNGKPSQPKVAAKVRIGEASLTARAAPQR